MKVYLLPFLALAAGLVGPAPVAAESVEKQKIPTVTRLVQAFTALESELTAAVQKSESAVITKMISDDFELRTGAMPSNPTPRADWLHRSLGNLTPPFHIEQMAVHDYGATAVVSFLWKQQSNHDIFIIDVWTKSADTWRLSVRYANPAGQLKFPIPGAAPEDTFIEKKY